MAPAEVEADILERCDITYIHIYDRAGGYVAIRRRELKLHLNRGDMQKVDVDQ